MSSSFPQTNPKNSTDPKNLVLSVPSSTRRMRIGCVIHSLDGGGAERVMAGLASRLADRGHEVTLITLDDASVTRHRIGDSVRRLPLNVMSTSSRRVSLGKRLWRLRRAIGEGGFEVVLSFCDATNLLVLLATRGLPQAPPVVVSERSDPAHQSLGGVREWLRTRMYRRAASVICQSDDVAATLQSRMGVRAVVIPSAVDPPPPEYSAMRAALRRDRPSEAPLRLLAIGRLEPEKGFERLVRALANVAGDATMPAWRLVVLGDGSGRAGLQDLVRERGLQSQVEFRGWVDSVWPGLAETDVFVLPSFYEGFPSALLEAMAGGVAVLAVDAGGGVRAVLEHGENGWLVGNSDAELMSGLREVLRDAALRQRVAASAPAVLDRFGWPAMVDAYEQALASAPPAASRSVTQ